MTSLLLDHIQQHVALTPDQQRALINCLRTRHLRKKQYLLQQDDICLYESFVTQGCLRCYEVDANGREHIVQFAFENWWVGDLYSFLTQTPARYSIDALEDTQVLQIDRSTLDELYERIPPLERYFRIMIQHAFIASQRRVLTAITLSAQQQYDQLVARYPQLEQRVAQQHIASYLGITPESLSRLRRQAAAKD